MQRLSELIKQLSALQVRGLQQHPFLNPAQSLYRLPPLDQVQTLKVVQSAADPRSYLFRQEAERVQRDETVMVQELVRQLLR